MHKWRVFATLTLIAMTPSCAKRVAPANIVVPAPAPSQTAAKPQRTNVETRRRAEKIMEDARQRLASRARQVVSSARPEQRPKPRAQPPLPPQRPLETRIWRDPPPSVEALPPPPELAESTFPGAALMPPPPQPAEPTFPSPSPTTDLPLPKPAEPSLSEVSLEAAQPSFPVAALMPPPPEPAEPIFPGVPPVRKMPSPPEPAEPALSEVPLEAAMPVPPMSAEPSFPVTALPPPSEAGQASLDLQNGIAAGRLISIPFPEPPAYLSLRPRFDWVDVVGSLAIPRSPLPEVLEASPERETPSLIRNPWPFPTDAS